MLQFYKDELASSKNADVIFFVNRVRYMMVSMRPSDLRDNELLYQWLFEELKGKCGTVVMYIWKGRRVHSGM